MADLIYKWPSEYSEARILESTYDKLVIYINKNIYAFIRSSIKNTKNLDPNIIYCLNSYNMAKELINNKYKVRLMLPSIIRIFSDRIFSDKKCYVLGKISRNKELLKENNNISYYNSDTSKFLYNIPYKYKEIFFDNLNFNNYGLEDIISVMGFTQNLVIPNIDGIYTSSPYYSDIEALKRYLRVFSSFDDKNIIYDTYRVNSSTLALLANIPKGYMDKYIFCNKYNIEDLSIMFKELKNKEVI